MGPLPRETVFAGLAAALACSADPPAAEESASTGPMDSTASASTLETGCGESDCSQTGGTTSGGLDADCEPDFRLTHRFLWITRENGTVVKFDLDAFAEVASYRFSAAEQSGLAKVGLSGDVIVHSDEGAGGDNWMTKIRVDEARCIDRNNNGTIETSRSADETLAFGEDECVVRVLSIPGDHQWGSEGAFWRSAGAFWTPGVWDDDVCTFGEEYLWTSYESGSIDGYQQNLLLVSASEHTIALELPGSMSRTAIDGDGRLVDSTRAVAMDGSVTAFDSWAQHEDISGWVSTGLDNRVWFCGARSPPGGGIPGSVVVVGPLDGDGPSIEIPDLEGLFGDCLPDSSGNLWTTGFADDPDSVIGPRNLLRIDTEALDYERRSPSVLPVGFDVDGRLLWVSGSSEDEALMKIQRPGTGDSALVRNGSTWGDAVGTHLVMLYEG